MGCEPRRRVHRRISRDVTPRTTGHEARPTHERPRLLASGQRGDDDARRTGTPEREGPGRARRGRPNCLLFYNSVVRHTTKCGSGTESPRTWNPLEEGSLREADARVARRRGRPTRDGPPDRYRREAATDRCGQVHKGTGGMPRRHQNDVGVEGCDKSGGAALQASIPECPRKTRGTETSQYPEEKKSTRDSLSSGERTGTSLNRRRTADGVVGPAIFRDAACVSRSRLENGTRAGDSPVGDSQAPRAGTRVGSGT
jgi:hypothetical protein